MKDHTNILFIMYDQLRWDYLSCYGHPHLETPNIERVIPTCMGLVRQIDDHLGRLLRCLEKRGLTEQTMIAFTSDHGDYLGDHWLGEKDLFHECSARIPMIVCDPSPAADATRGTVDDRFVEAVDLLPTFVQFAGGEGCAERVEGRSLYLFGMGPERDERLGIMIGHW